LRLTLTSKDNDSPLWMFTYPHAKKSKVVACPSKFVLSQRVLKAVFQRVFTVLLILWIRWAKLVPRLMCGAKLSLPQYVFTAWCLIKQGTRPHGAVLT